MAYCMHTSDSDMDSLAQNWTWGFEFRVFLLLDGLPTMANELHLPNLEDCLTVDLHSNLDW